MAKEIEETIFDHDLTEEETKILGFDYDDEEEYRKYRSPNSKLADLTLLYIHRGDWAKAKEYFKKISNREYKLNVWQIIIGDVFFNDEQMERARRLSEFFSDALQDVFSDQDIS